MGWVVGEIEELNGGGTTSLHKAPMNDAVLGSCGKKLDIVVANAAEISAARVSTGGLAWSFSSSSSALTLSST